jgi:hypothetical protein
MTLITDYKQEVHVETLIFIGILAVIGWGVYRAGKRTGSRAGFSAGRFGRRRHK